MRRITVGVVMALAATVSAAPKLDAKDTAVMDEMVKAFQRMGDAVFAARGNCAEVARAIQTASAANEKLATSLGPLMKGPNADALQEYAGNKHGTHLRSIAEKIRRGTMYCGGDKAVAAAWNGDPLATPAFGPLKADDVKPRKAPVPADYEAKLAKLDAALAEYLVVGDALDAIGRDQDGLMLSAAEVNKACTKNVKLAARFGAVFKKQDDAFEALDKAMQAAVLEDQPRMLRQSSPGISWMNAKGVCIDNKAFTKAAKAVKLGK